MNHFVGVPDLRKLDEKDQADPMIYPVRQGVDKEESEILEKIILDILKSDLIPLGLTLSELVVGRVALDNDVKENHHFDECKNSAVHERFSGESGCYLEQDKIISDHDRKELDDTPHNSQLIGRHENWDFFKMLLEQIHDSAFRG